MHSRVTLLACSSLLLFPIEGHAQKLSADEQRIVRYIDTHTSRAVALLERSVNIESPTENLAGYKITPVQ